MKPIIEISKLKYQELDDFSIEIEKNSYLTILGVSGSGKTTLSKLICGIKKHKNVKINSEYKIIGVFSPDKTPFVSKNVCDELKLSCVTLKNKKEMLDEIIKLFNIDSIINKKINKLSYSEKQILAIACAVLMNPHVLVLDNSISNIDCFYKENILNALKKVNKKYKITIINFSNDSEESIYGTDIAIIKKGKLILRDKKEIVLSSDNNFVKNDLKVPFIVDLSIKLKYYNLVNNIALKKEELVKEIWG